MTKRQENKRRLLYVVDAQVDFMAQDGILSVPDAHSIIQPMNRFFQALQKNDFEAALFTLDTHFEDEYKRSPEAEQFPLHCEYNSKGWGLAVDYKRVQKKLPTFFMGKNTFDAFGTNPVNDNKPLYFNDEKEIKAYENLRQATQDPKLTVPGLARDVFLGDLTQTEICIMGVASDYCVHDAILGLLKRGATVVVMKDLVRGIGTPVKGRAATGKIEDVIALPIFKDYVNNGQLRLSDSKAYERTLNNERLKNARGPLAGSRSSIRARIRKRKRFIKGSKLN